MNEAAGCLVAVVRGVCWAFLLAILIYSIAVFHMEMLADSYISGFKQGEAQCVEPAIYVVPRTEYDEV